MIWPKHRSTFSLCQLMRRLHCMFRVMCAQFSPCSVSTYASW